MGALGRDLGSRFWVGIWGFGVGFLGLNFGSGFWGFGVGALGRSNSASAVPTLFIPQLQGVHPALLPAPDPAEQRRDAAPNEERLPEVRAALPAAHGGRGDADGGGRHVQIFGHLGAAGAALRLRALCRALLGRLQRRGEGAALRQWGARDGGARGRGGPRGVFGQPRGSGQRHRWDPVAARAQPGEFVGGWDGFGVGGSLQVVKWGGIGLGVSLKNLK